MSQNSEINFLKKMSLVIELWWSQLTPEMSQNLHESGGASGILLNSFWREVPTLIRDFPKQVLPLLPPEEVVNHAAVF